MVDKTLTFALTEPTNESRHGSIRGNEGRRRLMDVPSAFPIYQDYGAYYIDLYIGSPAQRQTVILDTGSDNVGIPCTECSDCGKKHTDPFFNQRKSESFRALTCSECSTGTCDEENDICKVKSEYLEGSRWSGKEALDQVHPGGPPKKISVGREDENQTIEADNTLPIKFSCMDSVESEFRFQLANGIAGLGMQGPSLWRQMYEGKYIKEKKFSLCLSRNPIAGSMAGSMTLGGIDERLGHNSTDLAYMSMINTSGLYGVEIRNIYVHENGGESVRDILHGKEDVNLIRLEVHPRRINRRGSILDSGTTATFISPEIMNELDKIWMKLKGSKFPKEPLVSTPEELQKWPTLIFQMKGVKSESNDESLLLNDIHVAKHNITNFKRDILVAMPPSSYFSYDTHEKRYIPIIRSDINKVQGNILGSNFMRDHNVLFDMENMRIGMVESDCNHNKILVDEGKQEAMVVVDHYLDHKEIIRMHMNKICDENPFRCQYIRWSQGILVILFILLALCTRKRSGKM